MEKTNGERLFALDILKTISIIAVILYHLGVLKNGYLGVESFFVVSGYSFAKKVKYNSFKDDVLKPIVKTLKKQYYLILFACAFILILGFFLIFPVYYKAFGYESFATLLLSSNVLQVLKATDYWNVANTMNPMMHMWYICVQIKSLVLLRCILFCYQRIFKKNNNVFVYLIVFAISFLCYLMPIFPAIYKFYLVPFRLYEIVFGCLLYEFVKKKPIQKDKKSACLILVAIFIVMLCIGNIIKTNLILGMIIVLLVSALFIYCNNSTYKTDKYSIKNILCIPGRYSFPVYVWHQIIISLSIMLLFEEINAICVLFVILLTIVFTVLTTYMSNISIFKTIKKSFTITLVIIITTFLFSGVTYYKKGVYYRYHEFGLAGNNEDAERWITYVDRVYSWEKEFSDDDRINVLIIGDSFGRDFANILSESSMNNSLDISYIPRYRPFEQMKPKIDNADVVFYSEASWYEPENLIDYCYDKLYIVGNKCFSKNTKVWLYRFCNTYHDYTVAVPSEFLKINDAMLKKYEKHYIDMMFYVLNENNKERVFTNNGYYISIDGKHLSKEGAMFYASTMNLETIFAKWINT